MENSAINGNSMQMHIYVEVNERTPEFCTFQKLTFGGHFFL